MVLQVGDEAVVRVTVATLWSKPEAVRPVDAPIVAAPSDVRGWIAAMTTSEQGDSAVVTQLLLGERVLVEEIRSDNWVRVVAMEQPAAGLDARGYPGWLPAGQLWPAAQGGTAGDGTAADGTASAPEPLVVDVIATELCSAADGAVVLPGVLLGPLLVPAGERRSDWLPVQVPGWPEPLWVAGDDVRPLPTRPPTGDEVLAVARRLLDAVYVWGGVSPYGIDCSGLVHLVWRRLGVRLPRDAHEQAAATTAVPPDHEKPGDLYFFARPGERIHHVGIVTAAPGTEGAGQRRMLHSCFTRHRVVEEVLSSDRAATLVGAHRV